MEAEGNQSRRTVVDEDCEWRTDAPSHSLDDALSSPFETVASRPMRRPWKCSSLVRSAAPAKI